MVLGIEPYHPELRGVFDYARAAGWTVAVTSWAPNPGALIRSWAPDGIVAHSQPNLARVSLRAWRRCPVPFVGASRNMKAFDAPCVLLDHEAAGRLAARHFIDRGFEHLAYCWLGHDPELDEQMAGFRATAEAANRTMHCLDWTARPRRIKVWSSVGFRQWLASELLRLPKPLGLMVESDWTGLETIEACREAGLQIPEQVALIGYYNQTAVCECALIPLSSVDPDLYRQGREAAELLDRLMRGEGTPRSPLWIPPKAVVVRQSSDVLAVAHLEVAQALRFIKDHYTDPLVGVPQIVAATTMSKSGLNHAFSVHLGSAIGEMLQRTRMEKAQQLLLSTRMTLKAVAAACGYGNTEHLRDSIIRKTGMSPRAWRRRQKSALEASPRPESRFAAAGLPPGPGRLRKNPAPEHKKGAGAPAPGDIG